MAIICPAMIIIIETFCFYRLDRFVFHTELFFAIHTRIENLAALSKESLKQNYFILF